MEKKNKPHIIRMRATVSASNRKMGSPDGTARFIKNMLEENENSEVEKKTNT